MRIAIIAVAVLIQSTATLDSQTLTPCSTFQGYRVCQDAQGYRSTGDSDGMRFGRDNQGNRWTTSCWQGIETTTVQSPGR